MTDIFARIEAYDSEDHEARLHDYDLVAAFQYNNVSFNDKPLTIGDIQTIHAKYPADIHDCDGWWIVETTRASKLPHILVLAGGCDYTGWD